MNTEQANNNSVSTNDDGSKDGITFHTFGQNTSIPLDIKKVACKIVNPAPFLRRVIIGVELTVVNNKVDKDISGKLRLTLPQGATVKKFEFLRAESDGSFLWYPATAVPKKQAKAVVYKEKEKGREVAAISDVASGSNVFEIEVSPLPFQKEVKCRLESLVEGCLEDVKDFVATHFNQGEQTETVTIVDGGNAETSEEKSSQDLGGAVIGECFGKTHFICRIPGSDPKESPLTKKSNEPTRNIERIAVVWDVSASMSKTKGLVQKRCSRLKELAMRCNEVLAKNSAAGNNATVTFELFTFGVAVESKGVFNDVDNLIDCINELDYDGGTDVTSLSKLFSNMAATSNGNCKDPIDSVLVFSDGMDNLGRVPDFSSTLDSYSISFPVHCIADENEVNLKCLRSISSASPFCPGKVFTRSSESLVHGVLYPQPILKSIKTDQADDAFVEETDDGFRCVPDHRLQIVNEPIGSNGALISGILGDEQGGPSTVSKITAEVLYGSEIHHFHFQLRQNNTDGVSSDYQPSVCNNITDYFHSAVDLSAIKGDEHDLMPTVTPTSILGYVYAEETYRAAENYGLKAGMDINVVIEELSVQYGFCSPESSLLMLYSIDQFLDNDILPPKGHPAYDHEKAVEKRLKCEEEKLKHQNTENDCMDGDGMKMGEIGEAKNEDQLRMVVQLSQKLQRYFAGEYEEKVEEGVEEEEEEGVEEEEGYMGGMDLFGGGDSDSDYDDEDEYRCAVEEDEEEEEGEEEEEECMGGVGMFGCCDSEEDEDGYSPDQELDFCAVEEEEEGSENAPAAPFTFKLGSKISSLNNSEAYAKQLEEALSQENDRDWKHEYIFQRNQMSSPNMAVHPSFFLTCARLVLKHAKTVDAIRIATNCLELSIEDAQMLRCVGYFLLSTREDFAVDMAIDVFDKVLEMQPCEPQSYLDGALVRFWKAHRFAQTIYPENVGNSEEKKDNNDLHDIEDLRTDIVKCQHLLSHVLTHQWADRFKEVEWPALILLHCIADLVKEYNNTIKKYDSGPSSDLLEWPTSDLAPFRSCVDAPPKELSHDLQNNIQQEGLLRCSAFDLALMVWLGWDTDQTDLDLHIREPSGNEVYYGKRDSDIGGNLSLDFTQGYGPEVYILREAQKKDTESDDSKTGSLDDNTRQKENMVGEYQIHAKYFASHQDSTLTGATSAVLWTLVKVKNSKTKKNINFHTIRLSTHKEMTKVGTVHLTDA